MAPTPISTRVREKRGCSGSQAYTRVRVADARLLPQGWGGHRSLRPPTAIHLDDRSGGPAWIGHASRSCGLSGGTSRSSDQPHRGDRAGRGRAPPARGLVKLTDRDLKDQALVQFPSGEFQCEQRLDRDRRDRAQPHPACMTADPPVPRPKPSAPPGPRAVDLLQHPRLADAHRPSTDSLPPPCLLALLATPTPCGALARIRARTEPAT